VVPVLPVLKLLIGKILPVPAVHTSLISIQMLINGAAMPLRLTIRASLMVHGARQRHSQLRTERVADGSCLVAYDYCIIATC